MPDATIYTDINAVANLRRESQQDPRAALDKVARQFESLFMQMMLKSMREAELGDDLFGSDQTRFYRDMYDKQLATKLSGDGHGLGIAELLVRQLQGALPEGAPAGEDGTTGVLPERQPFAFQRPETAAAAAPGEVTFDSPEEFVQALWPHAERAAGELGVAPEALIAQAALETGWGKKVIRHPDGSSSHNLFNIKADHRWDGATVAKRTLEYRDGVAQREAATFRAYDSYAESFQDYVRFLRSNPRYQPALAKTDNPKAFIEALQSAGYATDPNYARKINEIIDRDTLAMLKSPAGETLT